MSGDDSGEFPAEPAGSIEELPVPAVVPPELTLTEPNGHEGHGNGPALPPRPITSIAPPPSPTADTAPTGTSAIPAWYRSEEERSRSVYRRANPWWRRLLRGLIALGLLAVAGVGLYFGARALQDYLDQDRLPAANATIPEYRSTAFQLRSSPPAPDLNGTLTLDTESGAFEFIGRSGSGQAGVQAVSVDGDVVYVRRGDGPPSPAPAGSPLVDDLRRAIAHLAAVDTADDVLTRTIRDGYVELVDRTTEGDGETELTRYQIALDTSALSRAEPLEWETFQDQVVPGAGESDALQLTLWIDRHDVLVRLRDDTTGWTWERLTYSGEPFAPTSPGGG